MPPTSLYERVGGADGIDALVVDFYNRVLADALLSPFFKHTDIDKLLAMQREFFSAALDGPLPYSGRSLHIVHFGRGIKRRHFACFVEHLLATLHTLELSEREVSAIIGRVNVYVDDLVGGHGLAG